MSEANKGSLMPRGWRRSPEAISNLQHTPGISITPHGGDSHRPRKEVMRPLRQRRF